MTAAQAAMQKGTLDALREELEQAQQAYREAQREAEHADVRAHECWMRWYRAQAALNDAERAEHARRLR